MSGFVKTNSFFKNIERLLADKILKKKERKRNFGGFKKLKISFLLFYFYVLK
jgi:hypothetical protein